MDLLILWGFITIMIGYMTVGFVRHEYNTWLKVIMTSAIVIENGFIWFMFIWMYIHPDKTLKEFWSIVNIF